MDKHSLVILLIFGTPALAIVGAIVAAIVKMIGQQRLMELVQRERIAAIEKGLDLSQQPLLVMPGSLPARHVVLRKVQGLTIGGLLTLGLGIGLGLMFLLLPAAREAWPVGLVPAFIGIALLVSARVVRKGLDRE